MKIPQVSTTEGAEFPSEGAEFPSEGADLSAACAVSSLSFFFLAAFALVKFRCAYYSFMLNRKQKHVFQIIRIALVNDRSKLQKNIPTLYYQIQVSHSLRSFRVQLDFEGYI